LVLLRVEFTLQRTVASRPVRSYRTLSPLPDPLRAIGGLLSAALVVGLRPPGVTWHPALWSPDFPPLCQSPEGRQRQSPKGPQRQSPEGHQQSSDYPVNSEGGLYRDWWGVSSEITDMMKQTLQMAFFYPPQATL